MAASDNLHDPYVGHGPKRYEGIEGASGPESHLHPPLAAALERAEAAEAKLAEVEALCRDGRGDPCWPHMVEGILAVIAAETPAELAALSSEEEPS